MFGVLHSTVQHTATALYDYEPTDPNELSFRKGATYTFEMFSLSKPNVQAMKYESYPMRTTIGLSARSIHVRDMCPETMYK
jgi:hypothetical protein